MRTWQHFGSGCYQHQCQAGRLVVVVANHSYACYHQDQVIEIKIQGEGWLHIGGLVCPSCHELCGDEPGFTCLADSRALLR